MNMCLNCKNEIGKPNSPIPSWIDSESSKCFFCDTCERTIESSLKGELVVEWLNKIQKTIKMLENNKNI